MSVSFDHDVWGIIAGRRSPFTRQCFYFSEQDIYFALVRKRPLPEKTK